MDAGRRNEVYGTVFGSTVQAHTIGGDVHVHASPGQDRLIALHEELHTVRRQLVESMQAERNVTQVVWVLQTHLMRLYDLVSRLAWERDHLIGEVAHREDDLGRAHASQARTEAQLARAESERGAAVRLVRVARARLLALSVGTRDQALAHDLPGVGLVTADVHLDAVDAFLDEQSSRLGELSDALAEPLPSASPFDFDGSAMNAAVFDDRQHLVDANRAFCDLLGVDLDRLRGAAGAEVFAGAELAAGMEERVLVRADGTSVPVELHVARTAHTDGRRLWLVLARDLTERHRAAAEASHHQVTHDALTGLPNRVHVKDLLTGLSDGAGWPGVAVLICGLDNFTRVNDSLGHDAGDEVLMALARVLRDGVPEGCTAARMSGDEFAVVCEDVDRIGGADGLLVRVLTMLRTAVTAGGQTIHMSASGGAATPPNASTTGDDLLRFANAAMAEAKRGGAGRASLASPALIESRSLQVQLEGELRDALDHGGLVLHYQPAVDASGTILSGEALVRWQHPERGLLSPDVLLPVAERGDMLRQVDLWVLREALREAAGWPADVSVAVNLSGFAPGDPEFDLVLMRTVEDTGIAWNRVVLELVETALVDLPSRVRRSMNELIARGARFAIDDFGTGYSSLARVKDLPAKIIKVDRRFVSGMGDDSSDFAVARAIMDMARALNRTCVIQGVETATQFHALRGIGADAYQGWLFSRPVPAPEFRAMLLTGPLPVPNVG